MAKIMSLVNVLVFSIFIFGLSDISETQAWVEVEAPTVWGIYVFGDSLMDVGNNNYLRMSLAKANFPHNGIDYPGHKATGRFSNGKITADFLAEHLGLPTSPPYLSLKGNVPVTGVSFASGGAGFIDEKYAIPMTKQMKYFSIVLDQLGEQVGLAGAQEKLSKSLFAIVIGSNDLHHYFKSDYRKYTSQQYVDLMLSALSKHMKTLHSLGARKFLVTGIGALGCTPRQRRKNQNEECREEVNYMATKYNDGLKSMLEALKSGLKDMHYSYFDTYGLMIDVIKNPSAYGFTEVKAACCGLGKLKAMFPCTPISKLCSNRRDRLFWDFLHPSEAASQMFADMIYNGTQHTIPINVKQLLTL